MVCRTDNATGWLINFAGTLEDPIVVNSAGEEQYVGCTGCPADSHNVIWLTVRHSSLHVLAVEANASS